jgi:hypothetical protein
MKVCKFTQIIFIAKTNVIVRHNKALRIIRRQADPNIEGRVGKLVGTI